MADFKLGRIKFKWRGDWAVDTAYLIDDVIKYGGNTYVCIQNHTSPNNQNIFYTSPGTYTGYWSLQSESLYNKGAYGNSTWYKLNDLVTYGQRKYRTTTAHTSSSTVLDTSRSSILPPVCGLNTIPSVVSNIPSGLKEPEGLASSSEKFLTCFSN